MTLVRPWKIEPKYYTIYNKRYGEAYKCVNEPIGDALTQWKRGDIIKFPSSYYEIEFDDWKEWFLISRKDKKKFWNKNPQVPQYAEHQYAILMCRYRVTKYKYITFRDYGSHFMLISGAKPGRLKRCYYTTPYKLISTFPYVKLPKTVKNIFSNLDVIDLAKELHSKHGNTQEARTLFIETLQNKISEVLI